MVISHGMPWDSGALAFPPWGRGLRLSVAPRRAIRNGLGLFDAHNPWRSAAVRLTRGLVDFGGSAAWQWLGAQEPMDPDWWMALCTTVVEPVAGAVGSAALARRSDRFDVLFMDEDGVPNAFLKLGLPFTHKLRRPVDTGRCHSISSRKAQAKDMVVTENIMACRRISRFSRDSREWRDRGRIE